MGVDLGPNRFTGLGLLGQEMPVGADTLMRGFGGVMERDFVFAVSTRPADRRPFAPVMEVIPGTILIGPGRPVIGQLDIQGFWGVSLFGGFLIRLFR